MKKLIALTGACLFSVAGVFQASAQQLPNFGFDVWKGENNCGASEAIKGGKNSISKNEFRNRPGDEPSDWNGSSVNQKVMLGGLFPIETKETLVFKIDDNVNGGYFARIQNILIGVSDLSSVAPGFLNLGTPWVNASMDIDYCDGGVYGGVAFENTPDALSAKVKRMDKTAGDSHLEDSHLIAYLWNGSFTSKVGPSNNPTEIRTDVDRAIWNESQETGKLVAKCDMTFKYDNALDWTTMEAKLEYVEGAGAPEKMNVIVSAGDYWNRTNLKDGTALDVDDVKFVYYSRLASLTIGGVALEGFSSEKYEYTVNGKLPKAEDVAYTLLGNSPAKTVDVAVNEEAKTLTLTVTNTNTGEGVADIDGKNTHVYTINYVSEETSYPGYLNIAMGDSQIAYNNMAQVTITDYKNGTCDFVMPNLSVMGLTLGDIALEDVTIIDVDGGKQYKGHVDGMSLMEGAITANVTLNGRISAEGVADMDIDVVWLNEGTEIPIKVSFASEMTALEEAEGYYYVLKEKVPQIEGIASSLGLYLTGEPSELKGKMIVKDVKFEEDEVEQVFGDIVLDGVEISGSPTDEMVFGGTIDNVALANGKTATAKFDERSIRHTDGSYFVIFTLDVEGVSYEVGFGTESIPASVEDVAAAGVVVNGAEGKIVVSGFNGQVEVYALDGVKVAQTAVAGNGEIKLARGIYVVRAGNQAVKVAVK